ncbi:MAG: hypothetical protein QM675_10565 [Protaetiibacter sp.]
MSDFAAMPGGALVERGLAELGRGRATIESLLVSTASTRLKELGVEVPGRPDDAEERLWSLLQEQFGDAAHARLNSLRRELVSFQHACAN